jgi:hypothetical protein
MQINGKQGYSKPAVGSPRPTSAGECLVDEVGHLREMQGNVGLSNVEELEALVLDIEGRVVGLVGVHLTAAVSLRRVEHMGDAQSLEVEGVAGGAPARPQVNIQSAMCYYERACLLSLHSSVYLLSFVQV